MSNNEEIWVIGHKQTNADKSFAWHDKNFNITDADIIIVDMRTIPTASQLEDMSRKHVTKELQARATFLPYSTEQRKAMIDGRHDAYHNNVDKWIQTLWDNIEDKVCGGGHVILLLHRYEWAFDMYGGYGRILPFLIDMVKDEKRTKIHWSNKHILKEYLCQVKEVNYTLDINQVHPTLTLQEDFVIRDNSRKVLGAAYVCGDEIHQGRITLLPSSVTNSSDQEVEKIISILKNDACESPPHWTKNVTIPGMDKVEGEINGLYEQKNNINDKIKNVESKKKNLGKYYDLLFSSGHQLEIAVKNAFCLLGFGEIKKLRNSIHEDWIIDLKSISNMEHGVLEVKGRNSKTNMADLGQCHKWVEDYLYTLRSSRLLG